MKLDLERQLEAARKQRGWTQEQLAKRCKMSQGVISKIERGEDCRLSTLKRIVDELNIMIWI